MDDSHLLSQNVDVDAPETPGRRGGVCVCGGVLSNTRRNIEVGHRLVCLCLGGPCSLTVIAYLCFWAQLGTSPLCCFASLNPLQVEWLMKHFNLNFALWTL